MVQFVRADVYKLEGWWLDFWSGLIMCKIPCTQTTISPRINNCLKQIKINKCHGRFMVYAETQTVHKLPNTCPVFIQGHFKSGLPLPSCSTSPFCALISEINYTSLCITSLCWKSIKDRLTFTLL